MTKLFWAVAIAGLAVLTFWGAHLDAQGPGEGGAVLRNPFDPRPAPPMPPPSRPGTSEIEKTFFGKGATPPTTSPYPGALPDAIEDTPGRPKGIAALRPSERDDINKDIAVTPAQGPWMISVMSYVGPKAPEMAREFVMELRDTYKMQAFVFNHGVEERAKEYERVKAIFDKQKKFCEDNKLPLDQKIRIRYTYVPDQCAVLVGGYSSDDAALRDVERIRKLPMPDPAKVKMDVKFFALGERETMMVGKNEVNNFNLKNVKEQAGGYVNPFKRAFPVHNPTVKTERKEEADPLDISVLRKLNKGEPYSLLDCRKPITLAITQFRTPTTSLDGTAETPVGGLMNVFGIGKKKEREDYAAFNANSVAENLRKHMKLDAYVLHTRFASIVTVGGYDSIDDPNYRSMHSLLKTRLRIPTVDIFPEPYPMKVPR